MYIIFSIFLSLFIIVIILFNNYDHDNPFNEYNFIKKEHFNFDYDFSKYNVIYNIEYKNNKYVINIRQNDYNSIDIGNYNTKSEAEKDLYRLYNKKLEVLQNEYNNNNLLTKFNI